jgi:hypothetical protein
VSSALLSHGHIIRHHCTLIRQARDLTSVQAHHLPPTVVVAAKRAEAEAMRRAAEASLLSRKANAARLRDEICEEVANGGFFVADVVRSLLQARVPPDVVRTGMDMACARLMACGHGMWSWAWHVLG